MSSERMEDQAGTPRGPPPGQWGLLVPGGPLRGCSPHAPPSSDSWRRHSQNMKSSVQSVLHSAAPRPPGDPVPQPGRHPPAPICASNPSWTFLASGAKEHPPSAAHGHLRSTEAGGSGGVWVQTHTPTPAPWSPLALPPAPLPRPTGPPGVGYGVLSHDIKTGRATGAWLRDSGSLPGRPVLAAFVPITHRSVSSAVAPGAPLPVPPAPALAGCRLWLRWARGLQPLGAAWSATSFPAPRTPSSGTKPPGQSHRPARARVWPTASGISEEGQQAQGPQPRRSPMPMPARASGDRRTEASARGL